MKVIITIDLPYFESIEETKEQIDKALKDYIYHPNQGSFSLDDYEIEKLEEPKSNG